VHRVRGLALATVLVLLAAACGRSDSPPAAASSSAAPVTSQSRLDSGSFGDLTNVCRATGEDGRQNYQAFPLPVTP